MSDQEPVNDSPVYQPDVPPPAPVPPTAPAAIAQPPRQVKWPTVVGIIMLVWAIFCVLGGGCGVFGVFTTAAAVAAKGDAAPSQWMTFSIVSIAVGLIPDGILLASALGMLKHRPWSIPLSKIYAGIQIVISLIGTGVSLTIQQPDFTGQAGAMGAEMAHTIQIVSVIVGLIFSCALPVFLLIWLFRDKVKADIATWNGQSSGVVPPQNPVL